GVTGRAAFEPSRVGRVLRDSMKMAVLWRTKPFLHLHKNVAKRLFTAKVWDTGVGAHYFLFIL
ncbi:hypothetical protein, partial [Pectobacterium polaris]|uniref:hypothetical protein n=1 Tax=Pectobacterium polaris TaxID=2042057 RepID=UPI001CA479B0